MIAAWMLWSIGAGLLFLAAGLAAERLMGGGRRWVWAAAGAGTVLLPAVRFLSQGSVPEAAAPTGAPVELEPLTVVLTGNSVLHSLDGAVLAGWVALSSILAAGALMATVRFVWRRRAWEDGLLLGRRVLWSRDSGPAVVGLLTPSIVLPAWVAGAGRVRQELILGHEEEHLRARDVQLRFLAALVLFAFPWNPALWAQHRRLGLAVELDCDRRVLERWPRRRRLYGDLLLRVGVGGGSLPSMGVAALAEQPSLLERRIRALLSSAPEVRLAQAAFLGFCAILVVGVALMVPGIVSEGAGPEAVEEPIVIEHLSFEELPPPPADVADPSSEPTRAPFDVKPEYRDKEAVVQALAREYPPLLRDAGIGGTAIVWFFVGESGEVRRTRIKESSGSRALDDAALRVARDLEFTPARLDGAAVPVWISMPVTFGSR